MKSLMKPFALCVVIYSLALLIYALPAVAQVGDQTKTTQSDASASETKSAEPAKKAENTKEKAASPKKGFKKMYAVFETSMGNFKVLLFHAQAPKTVENFVGLAEGTKDWLDPKTKEKKKGKPFYNG